MPIADINFGLIVSEAVATTEILLLIGLDYLVHWLLEFSDGLMASCLSSFYRLRLAFVQFFIDCSGLVCSKRRLS